MQKIVFGTDGFRGLIADNFTFETVARISQAIADYFWAHDPELEKKKLVVGYDCRFLSRQFAAHAAQTLGRHGVAVLLAETPVPTPAVSSYIRQQRLPGGMVITASHNPPTFNGIKIKDQNGASAPAPLTKEVENLMELSAQMPPHQRRPQTPESVDLLSPYIKKLGEYVDIERIGKRKLHVLVDPMHGAGSGILEKLFHGSRCRIASINAEPDPLFGGVNPEPIPANLQSLADAVKSNECDLALAFDGDADRIGAICPDSRFINSHYAICILLTHLIENRKQTGRVIKSLNTTTMMDKIAGYYGLKLEETPVGFKYIAAEMLKGDVLLGGEESGGIGFKNYMPERDGVLAGLLMLEMMAMQKKSMPELIADMEKRFGRYYYLRKDVKVSSAAKEVPHPKTILNKKVVEVKTYDGTKFILEDESWLIIRASGTEPIVRIYAESKNAAFTKKLIQFGLQEWTKP